MHKSASYAPVTEQPRVDPPQCLRRWHDVSIKNKMKDQSAGQVWLRLCPDRKSIGAIFCLAFSMNVSHADVSGVTAKIRIFALDPKYIRRED